MLLPLPLSYHKISFFQGRVVRKKDRKPFSGVKLGSQSLRWVAPIPSRYVLECSPTSLSGSGPRYSSPELHCWYSSGSYTELPSPSGPTHPCSNTVDMEPFPTSLSKVLDWIIATTTKICTGGRSTWDHSRRLRHNPHTLLLVTAYRAVTVRYRPLALAPSIFGAGRSLAGLWCVCGDQSLAVLVADWLSPASARGPPT
jgi:hypothetical protein